MMNGQGQLVVVPVCPGTRGMKRNRVAIRVRAITTTTTTTIPIVEEGTPNNGILITTTTTTDIVVAAPATMLSPLQLNTVASTTMMHSQMRITEDTDLHLHLEAEAEELHLHEEFVVLEVLVEEDRLPLFVVVVPYGVCSLLLPLHRLAAGGGLQLVHIADIHLVPAGCPLLGRCRPR